MKDDLLFLIRELANLNYIEGRHSGKWEYCEDKEIVGDEYLEEMFPFAKAYGVPFDYELENNFDEEEWDEYLNEGIGYAMDALGHSIKETVEDKLISRILSKIEKEE